MEKTINHNVPMDNAALVDVTHARTYLEEIPDHNLQTIITKFSHNKLLRQSETWEWFQQKHPVI